MSNPRITKKERGLIKGALRRVFSRSELRRAVIQEATIKHSDNDRPRVTKWVKCFICKEPTAAYQAQVDHKIPVIGINKALEDISWDELVDRLWCFKENLDVLCKPCHALKTKEENKARRKWKKENQ